MNRVSWIALPNGIVFKNGGWQGRISIFAALQLDPGQKERPLGDFPRVFRDWPNTVLGIEFGFSWTAPDGEVHALAPVRAVDPPLYEPDLRVWRALFDDDFPVRPWAGASNADPAPVAKGIDARELRARVRSIYRASLRSNGSANKADALLADQSFANARLPQIRDDMTPTQMAAEWENADPLERFALLHEPVQSIEPPPMPMDLHEAMAVAAEYPALLRALGLARDFTFDAAKLDGAVGPIRLRVEFEVPSQIDDVEWRTPATACQAFAEQEGLSVRSFHPIPLEATSAVTQQGMLHCPTVELDVTSEPVEDGALGAIQHRLGLEAAAARRGEKRGPLPGDDDLPPLRGACISAIAPKLAEELSAALARRSKLAGLLTGSNQSEEALHAEDLVRGHRFDVKEESDAGWTSLCRRVTSFRLREGTDAIDWKGVVDEGCVTPAVRRDEDEKTILYRAPPVFFKWDGYSLVVPRPGRAVDEEARVIAESGPAEGVRGLPLVAELHAEPGTLRRMRFGETYRFRGRAVDLAGNSWSASEADELVAGAGGDEWVSGAVTCARSEAVEPPALVRATELGHGEGGDLVAIGNQERGDGDEAEHRRECRFHLVPPAGNLNLTERSGVLDGMKADESWRILASHDGKLPEGYDATALKELGERPGRIRVPYLPDPAAATVLARGLPGANRDVTIAIVREPGGKPDADGFLAHSIPVTVQAGDREPRVQDGQLMLYLQPGTRTRVILTTIPSREDVARHTLTHWLATPDEMDAMHPEAACNHLCELTKKGELNILAGGREITLVHAVPRPLAAPQFANPSIEREPGARTVRLVDEGFHVHAASTGHVNFEAIVHDRTDDPPETEPRETRVAAFAFDVAYDQDTPLASGLDRPSTDHDLGDFRAHRVTYRATPTTRYREFHAADRPDSDFLGGSAECTLWVPASRAPDVPRVSHVLPVVRRSVEYPETNRWKVSHPGGSLRIFLERPWFSSGDRERLALVLQPAVGQVPDALIDHLSRWALNPTKRSQPTDALLSLNEITNLDGRDERPGFALRPDVAGENAIVDLALFDPVYDAGRGLWICDVDLNGGSSLLPFVRLALARWQEHAAAGLQLSPIVLADLCLLLPQRTVDVRRCDNRVEISVKGKSYLEQDSSLPRPSSSMVAKLQRRDSSIKDDLLCWIDVAETELTTDSWRGPWTGELAIPHTFMMSPLRVTVREVASFATAADDPRKFEPQRDGRLLFADAIELGEASVRHRGQ